MDLTSAHLTDGVITLRPFNVEDAEAHLAGEDDELVRWFSGGRGTLDRTRRWIERTRKQWQNDGPVACFVIVDHAGTLVGMIESNSDHAALEAVDEGDANIAYGLYPSARGKGYASRAVLLVSDFLQRTGVARAIIRVNPDNTQSLKVPVRCGFVRDRVITTRSNDQLVIFIKAL